MEYNRRQTNEIIKEKEKNNDFNSDINPVDWDNAYPVDEKFKYLRKGFLTESKHFLYRMFVIAPFVKKINKEFQTKVYGKENLENLGGAIITCNHVHIMDCIILKGVLDHSGHKVHITAAPFNNQKGRFGEFMRAGGLMPLSENLSAMRNFNAAMDEVLKKKHFVVFYPEQAMWLYYRKPRPFKNGAFHYASKHNVPIVPTFITFEDSPILDDEGLPKQYASLHIMPPIYPKKEFSMRENIEYLKNENTKVVEQKYHEVYKR